MKTFLISTKLKHKDIDEKLKKTSWPEQIENQKKSQNEVLRREDFEFGVVILMIIWTSHRKQPVHFLQTGDLNIFIFNFQPNLNLLLQREKTEPKAASKNVNRHHRQGDVESYTEGVQDLMKCDDVQDVLGGAWIKVFFKFS